MLSYVEMLHMKHVPVYFVTLRSIPSLHNGLRATFYILYCSKSSVICQTPVWVWKWWVIITFWLFIFIFFAERSRCIFFPAGNTVNLSNLQVKLIQITPKQQNMSPFYLFLSCLCNDITELPVINYTNGPFSWKGHCEVTTLWTEEMVSISGGSSFFEFLGRATPASPCK